MPNTRNFRTDVPLDRLRSLLHYDPETGAFTRLVGPRKGRQAGTPHPEGYTVISVDGVRYLAHRLAVFYVSGEWPDALVDHKNRRRGDTRATNLRPANSVQNSLNADRATRDLPRGVFRRRGGRFRAVTTRRDQPKRSIHIGTYDTAEEAAKAWRSYMIQHHGADFIP